MEPIRFTGELRRALGAGLLLSAAVLFLLPLAALGGGDTGDAQLLPAAPTPIASQPQTVTTWDESREVAVLGEDGGVTQMTMEDYLWRVVAAEMPASFEPQALRAQAVCARTYTLWKLNAQAHGEEGADICTDSACCQAYIDPQQAAANWGDQSQTYTEKIAQAVSDTDGQILTYEGSPIQAVFFSSSTAATEDAQAVWGNSLPYLVSVDSPEGEEVPNYHSTVTLTADQVRELVVASYGEADLSGDPSTWFSPPQLTASGRVAQISVGGVTLSGGAARSLFSLRSACFEVSYGEGNFTFSVTGYGHGVGMSQYGANAMAANGSTWEEILLHYYTGVTLQQGV